MKTTDYYKLTSETAIYPTNVNNFGLNYCYLGLLGETSEFDKTIRNFTSDKKNVLKEAGDVFWYVSQFCKESGLSFENVVELAVVQLTAIKTSRVDKYILPVLYKKEIDVLVSYAENIKKYYRDDKPLNVEKFEITLSKLLGYLLAICHYYDVTLPEILKANIDKLFKRRETNTIKGDGDNREEQATP